MGGDQDDPPALVSGHHLAVPRSRAADQRSSALHLNEEGNSSAKRSSVVTAPVTAGAGHGCLYCSGTGFGRAVSYALRCPGGQPHQKGPQLLITVVTFPVTDAGLCQAAQVPQ